MPVVTVEKTAMTEVVVMTVTAGLGVAGHGGGGRAGGGRVGGGQAGHLHLSGPNIFPLDVNARPWQTLINNIRRELNLRNFSKQD